MSKIRNIFSVFFIVACALLIGQAAQAQQSPFDIENVPNVIGVGIGMVPDYQGSDDYMAGGAPFFRLTLPKSEYYLRLLATDLQANIIDHPWFRLGPALNYRFGRNDDIEDSVVKHMKEIDGTIEAGAFVGVELVEKDNPRQRFLSQIEFLSDVGGKYQGYNVSLTASYWFPVHKAVDLSFGGGITYTDDNYTETYFGVDNEDHVRTGLPVFEAEGGFTLAKLTFAAILHLSESWHIAAGAQWRPLLDDAADSPIVEDRGDKNQWIYGIGAAYSW
jgi:outer membrane protein